jgi:hypothetical protein
MAKSCRELRAVNLSGCLEVDDAVLFHLVSSCPNLLYLNLVGTAAITSCIPILLA